MLLDELIKNYVLPSEQMTCAVIYNTTTAGGQTQKQFDLYFDDENSTRTLIATTITQRKDKIMSNNVVIKKYQRDPERLLYTHANKEHYLGEQQPEQLYNAMLAAAQTMKLVSNVPVKMYVRPANVDHPVP